MYANREAMTASPARNASGAAASSLRRELLLNMDHLQVRMFIYQWYSR